MKGFLPFLGRYLSPRYLFLPIFILLCSASIVHAKTVVVGAGFGSVSVNGMNGLNPGDVLAVTPGKYSGGSFANLKGITITNNGGAVIFNGQVVLGTLVECTFTGFQFKDVNGISIRWNGNSRRCIERNISFYNVSGSTNDAQENNQYTGDTSSLKMYMMTFDSLTLFKSGLVLQASYGNTVSNVCFVDSIIMSRIKIDSTVSNGTEVRGVFFRMHAYDWKVTYVGVNTVSGDVGIFQMVGNGSFHNIYRNGGRGYIMRLWNAGLGSVGNSYFFNNIDLNSEVYGTIGTEEITLDQMTKYCTGGNTFIYNNTSGNKSDDINYWASLVVIGYFPAPWKCEIKNNLAFNLFTRGKPPICMDQSSGTWVPDSAKNVYFTNPNGVVDPVTGVPVTNSPVIGKGVTTPWITDDAYHNPRVGAYDIGAVQHGGAIIPPPPNVPPIALAGAPQTITMPVSNSNLDGTKSYDPDGSISKYVWTLVTGTGGTITNPAAASTSITGLTQGTYIYKLTVTDNGNATASVLDTIIVKAAANLPPTANAGADQTITLPVNSTSVDGSASKDQDNGGLISSYAWSQSSGPSTATIGSAGNATSTISGLQKGTYVFKLTVTDASGATAVDSLTIIVKAAANLPPTANAGADQTITLPVNSTSVDGSASKDQDNGGLISSYVWSQSSGPSTAVIGTAVNATSTISGLTQGTYVFKLTVTDAGGATAIDSLTIMVNMAANIPPVANAGTSKSITLPVNTVNLDGSLSSDPDGTIVSYGWVQISGPLASVIANPTSSVTAANNLVAGQYIFELSVKDNSGVTTKAQVKITVLNAGPQPPIANAGANQTIKLPVNQVSLDGSASAPSANIVSYSWTQISGPSTANLTAAATAQTNATGLMAGTYLFQLSVIDNNSVKAMDSVTITVNPATNIPPVANAGSSITITLPTNTAILDGSKSSDADGTISTYSWIKISGPNNPASTGAGTSSLSLTGLIAGQYGYQLTVTDNSGATAIASVKITVVPPPNILPVANAGSSITITLPTNTATLDGSKSSDADGTISSYSWIKISGPNDPASTGAATASLSLTGLIAGQYSYQLTVTDNSGATATALVKITVVAPPNTLPIANAGPDQTIVAPVSSAMLDGSASSDPDGTITTYTWVMYSGQGSVTISNGNTATPSVSGLNPGTYVFQLTVKDNSGAVSTNQMTITVKPAPTAPNQNPVANAGNNLTITAPQNSIMLNGSSSFDPDGTIQKYVWTQVSGPTTATISSSSSVSPTVSGLIVGSYSFQLQVTDNNNATNTDQVTVMVNPAVGKVNQTPVAIAGADTTIYMPSDVYQLNALQSYDPDGNITSYQWQEISGPNTASSSSMNGSLVDVGNLEEGVYEFQVTVTDNEGGKSTAMVKLSVNKASGASDGLILFPNPAHDVITGKITSALNGTVKVNVYDMNGRTVFVNQSEKSLEVFEKTYNISTLASGMYTIQVNIGNKKTMIAKFIKK